MPAPFNWYGSAQAAPYADAIAASAAKRGVPADLLTNQLGQESGFRNLPTPPAGSGSTATGIGQFVAGTSKNVPGYGPLDPTNPTASIDATAAYDAHLYASNGTWTGALKQYGTLANGDGSGSQVASLASTYDATGTGLSVGGTGTQTTFQEDGAGGGVSTSSTGAQTSMDGQGNVTGAAQLTPAQTAANNASSPGAMGSGLFSGLSGAIGEYFVRGAVLVMGLIFVAAGLMMFKNPVGDAIKGAASKLPVPV